MEGDLTWGGEHTIQYTDDVLWDCTPETYIILLTNVTQYIQFLKTCYAKDCEVFTHTHSQSI